jgi:hypothetical protein
MGGDVVVLVLLAKFPNELLNILPVLREATPGSADGASHARTSSEPDNARVGISYRPADEEAATTTRDPFTIDPAVVDRGVRGHAKTQNALASFLQEQGLAPQSPRPDKPQFDFAWTREATVHVAEVKSLTRQNEEQQLRLGLGQVLRYRALLRLKAHAVCAVLAVEQEPTDPEWHALCEELGVVLVTPSSFGRLS